MKQAILRNVVLVPTALVMILLTLFGTMTAPVEATLQTPTSQTPATQAATQPVTEEALHIVAGKNRNDRAVRHWQTEASHNSFIYDAELRRIR